jgi:hypothetical protein
MYSDIYVLLERTSYAEAASGAGAFCIGVTRALVEDATNNCSAAFDIASYQITTRPGRPFEAESVQVCRSLGYRLSLTHTFPFVTSQVRTTISVHTPSLFTQERYAALTASLRVAGFFAGEGGYVRSIAWAQNLDAVIQAYAVILFMLVLIMVMSVYAKKSGGRDTTPMASYQRVAVT